MTLVNTLAQAREALGKGRFDLLLLDVNLPDGSGLELKADSVIWAGGYLPMDDEAEQFRALAYDFWKIGDCAQVRKIFNARREGYNAGSNI